MPMFTKEGSNYSYPHPTTKEHAIAINHPWYVDFVNLCPHHSHDGYTYRYVNGDHCLLCVLDYALDLKLGNEPLPDWFNKHTHTLHNKACRHGNHPLITLTGSRKCVICQGQGVGQPVNYNAIVPPGTVIDRETAKALSLPVYRTGEKCKRGHDSVRFVSSSNCVECHRNR